MGMPPIWRMFTFKLARRLGRLPGAPVGTPPGGGRRWELEERRLADTPATLPPNKADLVDDRTWSDLEMDKVFRRWDQAITPPGSQYLYATLRTYQTAAEPLEANVRTLEQLANRRGATEALRLALDGLNCKEAAYLAGFLRDEARDLPRYYRLFYLQSVLTVAMTAGLFFHAGFLFPLIGLWLVNIVTHVRYGRSFAKDAAALTGLVKLLAAAPRVATALRGAELPEVARIEELSVAARRVQAKTRWVVLRPANAGDLAVALFEYLNLLCLFEITFSCWSLVAIRGDRPILAGLLEHIARLDALQGLAGALSEYPECCRPRLAAGLEYGFTGMYHPLVEGAVGNSLAGTGKSLLISGTNMAGKTTFMKTFALNCLLAQTVGLCLARSAVLPPVRVKALIKRDDTVALGQSYFLGEAKELLEILREAEAADRPFLLALDEIFRGTNSVERIAAGGAVLSHLAQRMLVIASTHDLELSALLETEFDSCHFTEAVTATGARFDYQLKKGPCTSRNAIQLLVLAGYPKAVTDRAEALAGERRD